MIRYASQLELKTRYLEGVTMALRVPVKKREEDKKELEERKLSSLWEQCGALSGEVEE